MFKFTPVRALLALSIIAVSCEDETETIQQPITIQFASAALDMNENDEAKEIRIVLSAPAPASVSFPVKINGYTDFTSDPVAANDVINVLVVKGRTEGTFSIKPNNNDGDEPDRDLQFELGALQHPFVAGQQVDFVLTINDDDATPIIQSTVNFVQSELVLSENDDAGVEYVIQFSAPAALDSKVTIDMNSDNGIYAQHFTVFPEPVAGRIEINIPAGTEHVSVRVKPVSNTIVTGELRVSLSIAETTGSLVKGSNIEQIVRITDDELLGKIKGYITSHSEGLLEVTYEYDQQGRVFRKHWISRDYYVSSGTETYYYNDAGKISRINKHLGRDVNYIWTNGKVTRSEETQDDVLKSYVNYEYDDHGNIAGAFPYYRQLNGEFAQGMFVIYLYFTDGNVYKSLTYNPVAGAEPVLVSSRTYDNYSEIDNPFPMVEIIPTVVSQQKLPGLYQLEESGIVKTYHLSYTFDNNGTLVERTASGNSDTQVSTYQYY